MPADELSGKLVNLVQALQLAAELIQKEDDGFKCIGCGKLFSKTIGGVCVIKKCREMPSIRYDKYNIPVPVAL
jgi:hypothetical protein